VVAVFAGFVEVGLRTHHQITAVLALHLLVNRAHQVFLFQRSLLLTHLKVDEHVDNFIRVRNQLLRLRYLFAWAHIVTLPLM
jgi:hypothetical protein